MWHTQSLEHITIYKISGKKNGTKLAAFEREVHMNYIVVVFANTRMYKCCINHDTKLSLILLIL